MFVALPVVAVAGTAIYQRYNAKPSPDAEEAGDDESDEDQENEEPAENTAVVPAGRDPADVAQQWKAAYRSIS
jgi:hypothetical protein